VWATAEWTTVTVNSPTSITATSTGIGVPSAQQVSLNVYQDPGSGTNDWSNAVPFTWT